MNQPIKPDDESLSEELANLVQQLKQHRPRAARLDAAIFESERPIVLASSGSLSENGSESTYSSRRVSPVSQLFGVIAASWICGAVIGGGVMFLSMSRTNPGLSQSGVEIPSGASQPIPAESQHKTESLRPPLRTHEVAIGSIQNALNIDQLLGSADEPLHVLTRFSSHKLRTVRNVTPSINKTFEPIDFPEISAITETFSPANPVTRAELMQQYLESSTRRIY